ncbi:MAG: proteasome activator [Acidimicrobiia bacterium]
MEDDHNAQDEAPVTETALAEAPQHGKEPARQPGELITEPAKLMRIAAMARAMLTEAQAAPSDEAGRERLRDIYDATINELCSVLSDDLREELSHMFIPLEEETPSAAELRIAQAQLVGWLEGLFNGIQAAVMSQQLAAQAQLQHMGSGPSGERGPGQYL